jgi:hypothetical protein
MQPRAHPGQSDPPRRLRRSTIPQVPTSMPHGESMLDLRYCGMAEEAYRIEIKHRAAGSPAFRWEIYRGAEMKPIAASFNLFRSTHEAQAAGERTLLKLQADRRPGPEPE